MRSGQETDPTLGKSCQARLKDQLENAGFRLGSGPDRETGHLSNGLQLSPVSIRTRAGGGPGYTDGGTHWQDCWLDSGVSWVKLGFSAHCCV